MKVLRIYCTYIFFNHVTLKCLVIIVLLIILHRLYIQSINNAYNEKDDLHHHKFDGIANLCIKLCSTLFFDVYLV